MYYKGKWCTAGGKDPLFGHVDGFQIGPNMISENKLFLLEMTKTATVQLTESVRTMAVFTIYFFYA